MRLAVVNLWNALENRGCNPRGRPDKFTALCPAHEDRRPSLDVAQGEKGVVMTCRSHRCPADRIMAALGLEMRELFDDDGDRDLPPRPSRRRSSPPCPYTEQQVETWAKALGGSEPRLAWLAENRGWKPESLAELEIGVDRQDKEHPIRLPIRNREGKLTDVIRYAPNPQKRSGRKIMATKGVPRQPFPNPATVPGSEPIVLVEGETDAPTGRSLGFYTIGLPGQKWDPAWTKQLAGRDLLVVVENDDPGRGFADRVEQNLGTVARVTRLNLSEYAKDEGDGYDLTDFALDVGPDKAADVLRANLEEFSMDKKVADGEYFEDLAKLLDDVVAHVRQYVVLTPAQLRAIALWVVHTWMVDAVDVTPYLWVTSPERECGKTRLLEILRGIVARPWQTGKVTPAVLSRKIEAVRPTLLLDETDNIFKSNKEYVADLLGVLNTGYLRGGVTSCCVGNNNDFKDFATFCPKVITGIGKLNDTLESRCVPILLQRKAPSEQVKRYRLRRVRDEAKPLYERLEGLDIAHLLEGAEPDLPDLRRDRALDFWEPLVAIADLAGGAWPEWARSAAVELSDGEIEDETLSTRLLVDVRRIFGERGVDRLRSSELVEALCGDEEGPWRDYRGAGLRPASLSNFLRKYRIQPRSVRLEDGTTPKGYLREQFEDAWKRYAPENPRSQTPQRHNPATEPKIGASSPSQVPLCGVSENPEKPRGSADVAGVAATSGHKSPNGHPGLPLVESFTVTATGEEFALPGSPTTNLAGQHSEQSGNGAATNVSNEEYVRRHRRRDEGLEW